MKKNKGLMIVALIAVALGAGVVLGVLG